MKGFIALNVLLSVLILLSNAGCYKPVPVEEQIMERIEKTYSVNAGGNLTIVSDIGFIDVQTADRNQVEIVVTKVIKQRRFGQSAADALADFEVAFSPEDTDVHIEGRFKHARERWGKINNRLEIRYHVTVPKDYKVNVETSAGDIKLESVGRDVNAKTSAGDIQATMTAQPQNECSFRTSAGDITVTLIPDVTVDMDAETWAGDVSTDFTVARVSQRKFLKNGLKGSINGGGPLLKLRTSAGDIHLQKAAD